MKLILLLRVEITLDVMSSVFGFAIRLSCSAKNLICDFVKSGWFREQRLELVGTDLYGLSGFVQLPSYVL